MKQILDILRKSPLLYNSLRTIYRYFYRPRPPHQELVQRRIMKALKGNSSVFFVQVGSNDGVQGDPIHKLIVEDERWAGIFIEPVKSIFNRLKSNYAGADRFVFENIAIDTERRKRKFYYISEDAQMDIDDLPYWYNQLGSFNKQHITKQIDGIYLNARLEQYIVEEDIECVPLSDIFVRNNVKKLDLLHIDAEGFDYKVLTQVDFNKYKPSVILYENKHLSDREREDAESLLRKVGYRLTEYGDNTLAVT